MDILWSVHAKKDGDLKKLKGKFKDYWRLRVGEYRVIFSIEESSIIITGIGNRKDVY